jgi:hypothetical protein
MRAQLRRFLSLSLIVILTIGMSQVSHAQTNLVVDPSFEIGTTAPNPNPTGIPGWATFGGAAEITDPPARTGLFSMYMNGAPGGYYVPGAFQTIAASAGQTYTFSGWVSTPNTLVAGSNDFAIMQISYFQGGPPNTYATTGNGPAVGVNFGTPGTTPNVIPPGTIPLPANTWTFGKVTATAAAGTNSLGIYILNINADSNAVFQFDDMSLILNHAGDFNLDGHVNAADIPIMQSALANPAAWEATYKVTDATFQSMANVNGSGVINNGQLQALLNLVKGGGGSLNAVPEPSSLILFGLAGLGLAAAKKRLSA